MTARVGRWLLMGALAAVAGAGSALEASAQLADRYQRVDGWAKLPAGRSWGAVTGVYPDPDGRHIWVVDRCGANNCLGSDLAPVFRFDLQGNLMTNFGAGVFAWPHSVFVDHEGNVWVTDGPTGARAEEAAPAKKGQQVFKFSPDGRILLTLGIGGVWGPELDRFDGPTDVHVAPAGEIYVLDGHGADGNNRVVEFTRNGQFRRTWGMTGPGPAAGEFSDPHDMAMDSRGRLFIADRLNLRIQIYDGEGAYLDEWMQFGPPSGVFIDENDTIYVTDTDSGFLPDWYAARRSSDWTRGIRIGDARTGRVTAFIRSDAEFVAADRMGNVYAAEVQGQTLVKFQRIQDAAGSGPR